MRTFESEPMQSEIPRSSEAVHRRVAVAEVGLRRRAETDARSGLGDEVELAVVGVRSVDDGRSRPEAARLRQQLDRPQTVLREALVDLAGLLARVDVQREWGCRCVPRRSPRATRAGTRGRSVGRAPRGNPALGKPLDVREVGRRRSPAGSGRCRRGRTPRRAARARLPAAPAASAAQDASASRGSGTRRPPCSRPRAARGRRLVLRADGLRCLARRLGEHRVAPRPEVGARRTTAQRPLEAVGVGVDEAGQGQRARHALILSAFRCEPRSEDALSLSNGCPRSPRADRAAAERADDRCASRSCPCSWCCSRAADDGHSWPAAIVFAIAAITDQVDGWLARRLQVESQFGKYADPLADRLMIDVAVIMLFLDDRLPWPALVIIVGRDLLLVLGTRFVLPRGYEFSVSFLGKLATWILYLGIGLVIATPAGTDWPLVIFWIGVGACRSGRRCRMPPPSGGRCGDDFMRTRRGQSVKAVIMAGGEGTRLRPAHLEPAEADGADRRQAVHGAHRRAAARARARRGDRHARVPAPGDRVVLRRRRVDSASRSTTRWRRRPWARRGRCGSPRSVSTSRSSSSRATRSPTSTSRASFASTPRRDAAVTIALKAVDNPLDFGIVVTGEDGRIERFLEKPTWGQVFSDTINTGIYVLDPSVLRHIPDDRRSTSRRSSSRGCSSSAARSTATSARATGRTSATSSSTGRRTSTPSTSRSRSTSRASASGETSGSARAWRSTTSPASRARRSSATTAPYRPRRRSAPTRCSVRTSASASARAS